MSKKDYNYTLIGMFAFPTLLAIIFVLSYWAGVLSATHLWPESSSIVADVRAILPSNSLGDMFSIAVFGALTLVLTGVFSIIVIAVFIGGGIQTGKVIKGLVKSS